MRAAATILICLIVVISTPARPDTAPRLSLPLDCEIGPDCFVQKYVDHQRDKGYRDYRCGSLTNDGHGGTDFRLRDHAAMERDVAVVAAADGIVRDVRDGMPDVDARLVGRDAVVDRGLGNAVVIDHGGGWRTIYGHMRRNSVAVAKGQKVVAGRRLGAIGLSGLTEFPHVHFEVRFGSRIVDPFVGPSTHGGCDAGKQAMWRPELAARLIYRPTFLLHAGFSDRAMTRAALQYGLYERDVLPRGPGSLHFAVFVAGLHAGDRFAMKLSDGLGKTLRMKDGIVNRPAAVQFRSLALTRNVPLAAGTYRGQFTLYGKRDGKLATVLDVERQIVIR